jgi:Flp pilus assembly protein TadB
VNPILTAGVLWLGSALVLSTIGPLRRPSLAARVRGYVVPAPPTTRSRFVGLSLVLGDRLGRVLPTTVHLEQRLRQVHHHLDPTAFRFRQFSQAVLALGAVGAALAAAPLSLSPTLVVLLVIGAPVGVVFGHEQHLAAIERRQRRQVVRELPTVAEQLAMLLAAGRSVATALVQLGERGTGPCAADLRRVTRRLQQGVDEGDALREWADVRTTPGVVHLVGVLTLAREATDLDRLVEQEAGAIRDDAHRELLAALERRAQQVWVPVTVATLLPGSLLLLVPFLDALRLFAGP